MKTDRNETQLPLLLKLIRFDVELSMILYGLLIFKRLICSTHCGFLVWYKKNIRQHTNTFERTTDYITVHKYSTCTAQKVNLCYFHCSKTKTDSSRTHTIDVVLVCLVDVLTSKLATMTICVFWQFIYLFYFLFFVFLVVQYGGFVSILAQERIVYYILFCSQSSLIHARTQTLVIPMDCVGCMQCNMYKINMCVKETYGRGNKRRHTEWKSLHFMWLEPFSMLHSTVFISLSCFDFFDA